MSSPLTATILQETVIRVSECDERRRSKAMTAASKMDGVTSVAIVRERNHLVVIGVGVDSVELTRSLRRIFEYAHIVSVRNISGETSTEEACFRRHDFMFQNHYPTQSYRQPSFNYVAVPVYDQDPPPICSIM